VEALGNCPVCPLLNPALKPVLYRNDWTNRAGLPHETFLRPVPHCVLTKCRYLQNNWVLPSVTLSQDL